MILDLSDAQATDALGATLARTCPRVAVLGLAGTLGAGKSSLARAMLRALGVRGPIRSPTYTLCEPYRVPYGTALHLDLYRLADAAELAFLGLDERADVCLWLIEWPERGAGQLPALDLCIDLSVSGAGRQARLRASSELGRAWCARISEDRGHS